jgi:hypothetical protein
LILLILSLSQTTDVIRRGSPPNARFFQMAVWTYEYPPPGPDWQGTTAYVDIPMFGSGNAQPPGRSIMRFDYWYDAALPLSPAAYDWSRILAVVVDEPYATRLDQVPWTGPQVEEYTAVNPCYEHAWNVARKTTVLETRDKLLRLASSLHDIAPRTRFWVNFHEHEVVWMRDVDCPLHLNDPSIDVVSLDKYDVPFSSLEDEYEWFISTMPHQQIALVPGTFWTERRSRYEARRILYGYFDYANRMNRVCDLGFGRVGRTGNYDGCRVWIVAGWSALPWYAVLNGIPYTEPTPGTRNYVGLLHPSSAPISDAWRAELAKPAR